MATEATVPVLWHLKVSHYNEKARWALDYKAVPHVRRAAVPGQHRSIAAKLTGGRTFPVLQLNGEEGDDVFEIRAFALAGSQEPQRERTDISGGAGADLVQYAVNAPVNIDGGDGFDTVRIVGTEFADDFVITDAGVFGAGLDAS